ncbi:hypothetical protein QT338_23570 [Escherichia coli]|uniref:hypothetical protein n=1 Tax=Escherichia coli TaxID=562 RepID=UPI00259C8964|nr:hypothetical protein [Escherichia coli]MDM4894755.1 hypothetical protein [Escherichia coli]
MEEEEEVSGIEKGWEKERWERGRRKGGEGGGGEEGARNARVAEKCAIPVCGVRRKGEEGKRGVSMGWLVPPM